jgi:Mce-associated membrane protein
VSGRLRLAVTAMVTAALAVVGGGMLLLADHDRTAGPLANRALVDRTATADVISQVDNALNHVLSYSYRNPAPTDAAAKRYLTGDAVRQWHTLFTQLQQRAPGQKLTFVARVDTAGVDQLDGNSARLLVFLDQKSTRAGDSASSVAAAQVQVSAERVDGQWRISELHPL